MVYGFSGWHLFTVSRFEHLMAAEDLSCIKSSPSQPGQLGEDLNWTQCPMKCMFKKLDFGLIITHTGKSTYRVGIKSPATSNLQDASKLGA